MTLNNIFPELTNLEAEQGLLGAIFYENSCIWQAIDTVRPEDFYSPAHAEIYAACLEVIKEGNHASPVTLKRRFDSHPSLKDCGGASYAGELLASVISVYNVPEYARIVSDLASRRRLLSSIKEIESRLATDERPAADIASDLLKSIADNSGASQVVKTKRQVAMEAVKALELPPECYPTRIDPLDLAMSGGMYAGFTYGMAGQEKRGKTTLAHTISHNMNEGGVFHAYIALEMGSKQIEQRNLARMAGINSMSFLRGSTREDTNLLRRVTNMASTCRDNTLYLDMPGTTFSQLQAELARLISKYKIKGFILDYWQLVGGCPRQQSKSDFLYDVAQWVANFARRHNLWCILLSQVNRAGEIFGSSGLEKACDQLYHIELANTGSEDQEIWLKMTHSRYTPAVDVGSELRPLLYVNKKVGPFIDVLPEYRGAV